MIRLFKIRTLVLLIGEALIAWTSFLLGAVLVFQEDSHIELYYQNGFYKILGLTVVVLLCSHSLDLYDTALFSTKGELYFRLLMLPAVMAFLLAGVALVKPALLLGGEPSAVSRRFSSELGLIILTFALIGWRIAFTWLVQLPFLVERVYVLGTGERAQRLVHGMRQNPDLGVAIASWTGRLEGAVTLESVAAHLMEGVHKQKRNRVIVARPDRRGKIPMTELLELRKEGVKIEEATSWLEKNLRQDRGRGFVSQLAGLWRWFSPQHTLPVDPARAVDRDLADRPYSRAAFDRSEEHTSELQS